MAYSTCDVVRAMEADSGIAMRDLRVDGGAADNDWLMSFQAGMLGIPVRRPAMVQMTARGAAGLAGIATGFWATPEDFAAAAANETEFEPLMAQEERERNMAGWRRAVAATRAWANAAEGDR